MEAVVGRDARERQWQQCKELWTGEEARMKGIVFCEGEGVREVPVKGTVVKVRRFSF